ncbi:PaaI family thioesterase [Streptomyces sp. NPDC058001]|uniref:PaaI family thioesterase n=1 Tax=Streptomyces sp. NPDC058001 TaxID=3346300 RepID=UPI0036EBA147
MAELELGPHAALPPYGGDSQKWLDWADEQPASRAIGLRCLHIENGRAKIALERGPWPLNPNGAVHGGLVAACADHTMAIALLSTLEPGTMPATATLAVDFLRPALPPLTFEAVVDRRGRTMGFLTITVRDNDGRLAAKCHGTMPIDGSSRFLDDTPA